MVPSVVSGDREPDGQAHRVEAADQPLAELGVASELRARRSGCWFIVISQNCWLSRLPIVRRFVFGWSHTSNS